MFEHCRHCKEKRYPGCQDHCPDGLADKAEYEAKKAALDKARAIQSGLYAQRGDAVVRAAKRQYYK